MPEEFVVLRCKECRMFQKHISRKSNKFSCKICGEKQSIIRCYGNGTGVECRRTVQRLNSTCAEADSDEVDEELEKYSDELHEDVLRKNGYHRQSNQNEEELNEAEFDVTGDDYDGETTENNNRTPDEGFEDEYHDNSNGSKVKTNGHTLDDPDAVNSNNVANGTNGFNHSGDSSHDVIELVSKSSDQSPRAKRTKYSIF